MAGGEFVALAFEAGAFIVNFRECQIKTLFFGGEGGVLLAEGRQGIGGGGADFLGVAGGLGGISSLAFALAIFGFGGF